MLLILVYWVFRTGWIRVIFFRIFGSGIVLPGGLIAMRFLARLNELLGEIEDRFLFLHDPGQGRSFNGQFEKAREFF